MRPASSIKRNATTERVAEILEARRGGIFTPPAAPRAQRSAECRTGLAALEAERLKAEIVKLHENDSARMLPHTLATVLYLALSAAALFACQLGYWPLTIVLWLVAGHVGHSKLIAIHEAAHGTLSASRFRNELQGVLLSCVILVPLSVYRYVHGQHHAYLGTAQDLEMWPFVKPSVRRPWRLLAAAAELCIGFFYTPILFLRGVLVGRNIPRPQRIRIVAEYALTIVVWAAILAVVAQRGWWLELVVAYLIPAMIAGNLQSLRKFTEHLGLLGNSILTTTRTVVDPSLAGRLLSDSMLHIDYHGTHHRYAKLPYYNLPQATPYVYGQGRATVPIFPTYRAAMLDMFKSLGNPRVGRQWLEPAAAQVKP